MWTLRNLSEFEKQNLVEFRKKYIIEWEKSKDLEILKVYRDIDKKNYNFISKSSF